MVQFINELYDGTEQTLSQLLDDKLGGVSDIHDSCAVILTDLWGDRNLRKFRKGKKSSSWGRITACICTRC